MKKKYKDLKKNIVIFDSGIGGLSIYKKIYKIFPHMNYIYVFDNYGFPYGNKKDIFVIKRIILIIKSIIKIKKVLTCIIACNTASIIALSILRKKFKFPIFGIFPAIKFASKLTKNRIIGLLATENTNKHNLTNNLIKKFANNCKIMKINASGLVKLVEKKIKKQSNIPTKKIKNFLNPFFKNFKNIPDTIILGCTHFYHIKKEIKMICPNNINIIDSKFLIIKNIYNYYFKKNNSHIFQNNIEKFNQKNIVFYTAYIDNKNKIFKLFNEYGFQKMYKLNINK